MAVLTIGAVHRIVKLAAFALDWMYKLFHVVARDDIHQHEAFMWMIG